MKKNGIPAFLVAALLAFATFGFSACDSENVDEDDIHTTLEDKIFVATGCTLKVQDSSGTSTYTASNIAYIEGLSDDLVRVYVWPTPDATEYYSDFLKYYISDDYITFSNEDDKSYTATINTDDTFTIDSEFVDGGSSSADITDSKLTFAIGADKPSKAVFTSK